MSLIQDALKRKREEESLRPPAKAPAPSNPPSVEPSPARSHGEPKPAEPTNNPKPAPDKLLLALILLIVISLISIGIIKFLRSAPAEPVGQTAPSVEKVGIVVEKPAPVIAPDPEPEDAWPELKLTGFASAGRKKMVVINGKMLSSGGRIRGVRVIEIGEEEVVVEYQGEQRTLYASDQ